MCVCILHLHIDLPFKAIKNWCSTVAQITQCAVRQKKNYFLMYTLHVDSVSSWYNQLVYFIIFIYRKLKYLWREVEHMLFYPFARGLYLIESIIRVNDTAKIVMNYWEQMWNWIEYTFHKGSRWNNFRISTKKNLLLLLDCPSVFHLTFQNFFHRKFNIFFSICFQSCNSANNRRGGKWNNIMK